MVTQFVPGAYMVHDQLHIRGGHQVSWLVDGVPVPNTNIASNVGPQFDPKDVDTIEIQRGGYSAEFGDRTYGVFNVITRSGFEYNREAEVATNQLDRSAPWTTAGHRHFQHQREPHNLGLRRPWRASNQATGVWRLRFARCRKVEHGPVPPGRLVRTDPSRFPTGPTIRRPASTISAT
jgi:hypothetical protein